MPLPTRAMNESDERYDARLAAHQAKAAPFGRRPEPARRGPFWYLAFARMPQEERASAIRNEFFGKSPEEINDAAFDLARHAVTAGNWQALADTLPELRRLMGAVA